MGRGCGQKTSLAKYTWRKAGHTKGQPLRYVKGHNRLYNGLPKDLDKRYTVEHHGYDTPCWIWAGYIGKTGYGRIYSGELDNSTQAHRTYYIREYGQIPDGFQLHHLCGIRACVNPTHIEALDRREHGTRHRRITPGAHRCHHCGGTGWIQPTEW
jgi:hypothetical protein